MEIHSGKVNTCFMDKYLQSEGSGKDGIHSCIMFERRIHIKINIQLLFLMFKKLNVVLNK